MPEQKRRAARRPLCVERASLLQSGPVARVRAPSEETVRRRDFRVACESGNWTEAEAQADWLITAFTAQGAPAAVCEVAYATQLGREADWSAQTCARIAQAAHACGDAALLVISTRQLARRHQQSPLLPPALLLCARHQLAQGRPELARATLHHLVDRFAEQPAARFAERMLAHFSALASFGSHR